MTPEDGQDTRLPAMRNAVVVLARTTHSGNLGFCARAMRTMGASHLRLVGPRAKIDEQAFSHATSSEEILRNCVVSGDLPAALGDCRFVVAFTARRRRVAQEQLELREAVAKMIPLLEAGQKAGLLFGNEKAGLSNEEAGIADVLADIPTSPECPSLNLSHAVQVVLYELRRQMEGPAVRRPEDGDGLPASVGDRERLFEHFERVARDSGMLKEDDRRPFMARLRRILMRTGLEDKEVSMLRGFLTAVERRAQAPTGISSAATEE